MNRIRECRQNKKLTLKQASKELATEGLNLSADALGKYERSERYPKLETWEKLANFFNVSATYLMGISNSPNDGFDDIFIKNGPIDLDDWNARSDTKATKISTSLSVEQEADVVHSLDTYESILKHLIPYTVDGELDITNEEEKLKKNNLKLLINLIHALDIEYWPESQPTTINDLNNQYLKKQEKLNKTLKKVNKLLKDELKNN